jgi:tRNA nucleotidyltransferase (CCA-adding enzyme)
LATDWEATLRDWSGPASSTEEDKRERTERLVRHAIQSSMDLPSSVRVFAKGSYANNTNVRRDSDVDVAVEWTATFLYDRYWSARM